MEKHMLFRLCLLLATHINHLHFITTFAQYVRCHRDDFRHILVNGDTLSGVCGQYGQAYLGFVSLCGHNHTLAVVICVRVNVSARLRLTAYTFLHVHAVDFDAGTRQDGALIFDSRCGFPKLMVDACFISLGLECSISRVRFSWQ